MIYEENRQFDREAMKPTYIECEKCKLQIYYWDRIYTGWICKACAYGEQWIKLVTASPSLEILIECPHCEHTYDILDEDEGYEILNWCDFLNSGSHYDYAVLCPECEKEFLIEEIQY